MDASYVRRVVHALNDRFLDLPIFNATKFFSSRNYPSDCNERIINTKFVWKGYCWSFNTMKKKVTCVRRTPQIFKKTFQHECENNMIFKAWCICGSNFDWPKLIQLWPKITLVPANIAICDISNKMQLKATCTIG